MYTFTFSRIIEEHYLNSRLVITFCVAFYTRHKLALSNSEHNLSKVVTQIYWLKKGSTSKIRHILILYKNWTIYKLFSSFRSSFLNTILLKCYLHNNSCSWFFQQEQKKFCLIYPAIVALKKCLFSFKVKIKNLHYFCLIVTTLSNNLCTC